MDAGTIIAIVVSGLSVLIAVIALFPSFRSNFLNQRALELQQNEQQLRLEWEREKERRQLEANQPHLVPVGAAWYGLSAGMPQRFSPVDAIQIELQNKGGSMPLAVAAVLFPAFTIDKRYDFYWEGRLDESPAPGGRISLVLYRRDNLLEGYESLLEPHSLSASNEPIPASSYNYHYYYCVARLTLTYRDANGRTLGLIYDAESAEVNDALTQVWKHVEGPTEVET